jgi:succinate dehydrogenase / fumarate reductase flavoprotein subunit
MGNIVSKVVETEILVVGGGGAGITAAIGAARSGAKVLLVSKGQVGNSGNTIMIGGSFAMDGHSAYYDYDIKEADKEFTKADLYESIIKDGFYINDQNMVRQFVEESPAIVYEVVKWAEQTGKPFDFGPPSTWWMSGRMMGNALKQGLVSTPGIERISDIAVIELLSDGGRVCGALALELNTGDFVQINAKAVVLGTGGFQPFSLKNTNSDMTGDGVAMAFRAGAKVSDMEFLLFLMTALEPQDIVGSILPLMLVTMPTFKYVATDREGKELTMPQELKDMETKSEICKLLHMVYYGKTITTDNKTDKGGVFLKITGTDEEINQAFDETVELFRKFYKEGFYHHNDINKVRRMCLDKRRWEVGLGNEYSVGGILVNEKMETTVKGLFAGGECASGVFGANRVADAVTEMVVQGYRAGLTAAEYAKTAHAGNCGTECGSIIAERLLEVLNNKGGILVNEAVRRFEAISDKYLNCYRDGEGLRAAIEQYEQLEKELENATILCKDMAYNAELMGLIALKNRLLCSKLAAYMGEARKESRGLHLRLDYPNIDNKNYFVRSIAHKDGDNIELSTRKPIAGEIAPPDYETIEYERYLLETGIGLENLQD